MLMLMLISLAMLLVSLFCVDFVDGVDNAVNVNVGYFFGGVDNFDFLVDVAVLVGDVFVVDIDYGIVGDVDFVRDVFVC